MTKQTYSSWDVMVYISTFSIIVVDTWCVMRGILGDKLKDSKDDFYTKLAEEMIENIMGGSQRTRGRVSNHKNMTWWILSLDTND